MTEPAASARPRRWRRRLVVVAAALLSSAVVLAGFVLVGHFVFDANLLPGQAANSGHTGSEIFRANCAQCHGPRGEGGTLSIKGPAFTPGGPLSDLTFAERVTRISEGKPLNGMPAWGIGNKLTPDQIRRVAAYTQLLSGRQPEPGVEDVE